MILHEVNILVYDYTAGTWWMRLEIRLSNKLLLLQLPLREAENSVEHLKKLKLRLVEGGNSTSVIQKGQIEGRGWSLKGRGNTSGHPRQEVVPRRSIQPPREPEAYYPRSGSCRSLPVPLGASSQAFSVGNAESV